MTTYLIFNPFVLSLSKGERIKNKVGPLYAYAKKMAQEDNASLNQFIVMAVAEKVSALNTEKFFQGRAARGSRERFLEIMDSVPDLPVQAGDEVV